MKITQELTQLFASFIKKVLQQQNTSISPVLEVTLQDGDDTKVFRTQDSIVTIGRSVMNEIELPDRFISREHSKILKKHNKYFLLDLGSTNGTFLNRQALDQNREYPLKNGDIIQMERFRLHVRIESAEEIAEKQIQIVTQSITDEPFKEFLAQIQPADALAIYEVSPDCHQIYLQLEAPILLKLLGQKVFSAKPEHSKVWQKFENNLVELEYLINKNYCKKLAYGISYVKLADLQSLSSSTESKLSVIKLKIRIGEQSGYLRLGIPRVLFKSLVKDIGALAVTPDSDERKIQSSSGGSSGSGQEANIIEHKPGVKSTKLSRLQQVYTTLRIELGTFTISSLEWMKLGVDQVILLKGLTFLDESGNFFGEIRLRLPGDEKRFWIGQLKSESGSYTIKILKTIKTKTTDADVSGRMLFINENAASIELDAFDSSSELKAPTPQLEKNLSAEDKVSILKDINLFLKIELNQLKLKVADIINLKPGRVVQIKYPLSEKITITMNQKPLARGILFAHPKGIAVRILKIIAN